MFRGSLTALITPFRNGKVDEKAFQEFVEWQIQEGSHGLVPCGTTGESPTLSHDEHTLAEDTDVASRCCGDASRHHICPYGRVFCALRCVVE